MSIRAISQSEGSTLLKCQANWDLKYGDQLAGSSLKSHEDPVLLRDGRAWGRAVAAYHEAGGDVDAGIVAVAAALEEDAYKQKEAGVYDPDEHRAQAAQLRGLLEHYAEGSEPLPLDRLEHELFVPLPSRTGKRDSSRYRLQVFFDGIHVDPAGRTFLVEFKLRSELTALELIANSRQIRYYAWAYRKETGKDVAGVIVDERLKAVSKPARWVRPKRKDEGIEMSAAHAEALGAPVSGAEQRSIDQGKVQLRRTVSHAKDQLTTVASYQEACENAGVDPDPETLEQIGARRWQQRETIFLTEAEIEEAGTELVSLGRQIQALDSGLVYPVRNVSPRTCRGCFYREICNSPGDTELVSAMFDRVPAKKDRQEVAK